MESNKRYVFTLGVLSLVYVVLGLTLLIQPEALKVILCYILGIAAAVVGIIRIVWHFLKRDPADSVRSDIPIGVVMIIAGVYMIARVEDIWVWLPVFLGFAVLFDSILKMQHAFELKRMQFAYWWIFLLLGLIMAVLGVLLLLGVMPPEIATYYFGVTLMLDGVANIAILMLLMAKWRSAAKAQAAQPSQPPAVQPPEIGE